MSIRIELGLLGGYNLEAVAAGCQQVLVQVQDLFLGLLDNAVESSRLLDRQQDHEQAGEGDTGDEQVESSLSHGGGNTGQAATGTCTDLG